MGAGLDPGRKGNEFSESFLATSFFFFSASSFLCEEYFLFRRGLGLK